MVVLLGIDRVRTGPSNIGEMIDSAAVAPGANTDDVDPEIFC
jgi:hypothetical protein